jgi:hypothetical protein
MTVLQLRSGSDAMASYSEVCVAVGRGLQVPVATLSGTELAELTVGLAEQQSRMAAWQLSVAAEADRRKVAVETGDTDTAAWLARLTTESREIAAGGLWLAQKLDTTYVATRAALAAGTLRIDQAHVIVRAAEKAPKQATAPQIAEAEELLVGKATGLGNRSGRPMAAKQLRVVARRMFENISVELADEHEAAELERESDRAEIETWFTLHDHGDGTFRGQFVIPELHGSLLRSYLERLTAPRMTRFPKGDQPHAVDATLPSEVKWSEKLGQGFIELIEHLPTDGHPDHNGIGLVVRIDHDKLTGELSSAGVLPGGADLDAGVRISARDARRLACNAGIIPAVLGGKSQPLDLGRTRRLHSGAQRRALAALHLTCAIATCERRFAWTEIHHLHPWSHGGATDLADALPLCGHHHRRVHDSGFELHRHPNGEWLFRRLRR